MSRTCEHLLSCLLDGDRPWGSIDVRPDRFGVTRYRLLVYPPGISRTERRRVRVARSWPLWSVATWSVAQIYLGGVLDPWIAIALSIGFALGVGAIVAAVAGYQRKQVRTMTAAVMVGRPDLSATAERDTIQRLGVRLIRADKALADGTLNAVEHESVWWGVYDEMARASAESQGAQESGRSA
jgi:hypothetical protein